MTGISIYRLFNETSLIFITIRLFIDTPAFTIVFSKKDIAYFGKQLVLLHYPGLILW